MHPAESILAAEGFRVQSVQSLAGGDINQSCRVETTEGTFFIKFNDAALFPGMLMLEASGLEALRRADCLAVPRVIRSGIHDRYQYLVLEWIQRAQPCPQFWEQLGEGLAALHRHSFGQFGWQEDNYIGNLPQLNRHTDDWSDFYAQNRLLPLVRMLLDNGLADQQLLRQTESLCKRLPRLFPAAQPSLLHGDLWSGNYMTGADGLPVIFDPAVYAGHREMDLGMTLLFGGFDQRFYKAYHAAWPLEPGWQERVPLTQLYPLLVHAVLFGGHYINEAAGIIHQFA